MPNALENLMAKWRRLAAGALPDGPFASRLIGRPLFIRARGRAPLPPGDPGADLSDYFFSLNARDWSDLERRCVDKEKAKAVAKSLCPRVQVSPTLAVLRVKPWTSLRQVEKFLAPHLGKTRVAKTAHGSGNGVLLDRVKPGQIKRLYRAARRDYFFTNGERQYRGLEKKILVEPSLAPRGEAPPTDYRFFCTRGQAWFGAADAGRFVDLREYHFTVPDFTPVYIQTHGNLPDRVPARPAGFREMVKIAEALSKPFEFVRVDLYKTTKGIFFGEFTFTPMAGIFHLSNPQIARWLLRKALNPGNHLEFKREWRARAPKRPARVEFPRRVR